MEQVATGQPDELPFLPPSLLTPAAVLAALRQGSLSVLDLVSADSPVTVELVALATMSTFRQQRAALVCQELSSRAVTAVALWWLCVSSVWLVSANYGNSRMMLLDVKRTYVTG